mgnify:CR=1 FL=1
MSASRLHAAITALHAAAAADSSLVSLGVLVTDGLPVTQDRVNDLLVIGATSDEEETGASLTQDWHDLGAAASRDEIVRIRCYVRSQVGDVDVAGTRSRAFAVVAAVEALLRADIDLGLGQVLNASVVEANYIVSQSTNGTAVWVPFTVRVRALI